MVESAYTDDELEDLAKDDPELDTDVILDTLDTLDDSDDEVTEPPEAGKTDDSRKDNEKYKKDKDKDKGGDA